MLSTGSANDLAEVPAPQRQGFRFSLRELIVCVFMLGALLGLIIRGLNFAEIHRKDSRARTLLDCIEGAANSYWVIWREYPPAPPSGRLDLQYFTQLMTADLQQRPSISIDPNEVVDPWGNLLRVKVEKGKMTFWTCGPNGIDENGEGDDIALSAEN